MWDTDNQFPAFANATARQATSLAKEIMRKLAIGLVACSLVGAVSLQGQTAKRAITLDDHSRIINVGDPQRSPDGMWVAYTVTTIDAEKDRRNTDVWMVKWDGSEQLQLTSSPDGESSPRWSPDNKYLAFVASRGTDEEKKKGGQIWLLNRAGGEAQKVSDFKGGVGDIQWSPDSTRIAFTHDDEDPRDEPEKMDGWKRKTAPPIVIDRYHFKEDRTGYLKQLYTHIGVFDVATKTAKMITKGNTDDAIAVVVAGRQADRVPQQARSRRSGSHVERGSVDRRGARRRRAAPAHQDAGRRRRPAGVESRRQPHRACCIGDNDQNAAYGMNKLIVVPSNPPAQIGADDAADGLHAAARSRRLEHRVVGGRPEHLVPAAGRSHQSRRDGAGGESERRDSAQDAAAAASSQALSPGKDGNFAVLATEPNKFTEVYALEGSNLRQLTKHNQKLLDELQLATTEDFQSKSKDGTDVHGLIVKPAGYKAGTKYPTLLDHPRRPERPGSAFVLVRSRVPRRERLRRARDQLSRQRRPRQRVSEGDSRRLGQPRGRRSAGRG